MTEKIQITGTVETILPTQDFPSGFRKRVLVINTGGEYPQTIPVEFTKEKCDALDSLSVGQQVTAHVNLRGNEFQGKYYANIQGWRFEAGNEPQRTAAHSSNHPKREPKNMAVPSNRATVVEEYDEEEEEIPF
jgi:hypothetical protein